MKFVLEHGKMFGGCTSVPLKERELCRALLGYDNVPMAKCILSSVSYTWIQGNDCLYLVVWILVNEMLSLVFAYLNPPRNKVSPLSIFYSLFSVREFGEPGNSLALAHLPACSVVLQTLNRSRICVSDINESAFFLYSFMKNNKAPKSISCCTELIIIPRSPGIGLQLIFERYFLMLAWYYDSS